MTVVLELLAICDNADRGWVADSEGPVFAEHDDSATAEIPTAMEI